jgi:hypothetical protein
VLDSTLCLSGQAVRFSATVSSGARLTGGVSAYECGLVATMYGEDQIDGKFAGEGMDGSLGIRPLFR